MKMVLRLLYLKTEETQDIHQGARKKEQKQKDINSILKCRQPGRRMAWQELGFGLKEGGGCVELYGLEKIQRNIMLDGFWRYVNRQ